MARTAAGLFSCLSGRDDGMKKGGAMPSQQARPRAGVETERDWSSESCDRFPASPPLFALHKKQEYYACVEIIYWNDKAEKLIKSLDRLAASRVINSINLLEQHGHLLGMPDSKSLGGGLFELRTHGKVKVRILYVFHKNSAYIIHGFVKKAWKISSRDIDSARGAHKEVVKLA